MVNFNEKNKYYYEQGNIYGDSDLMPTDIKKKYLKYGKELSHNLDLISEKMADMVRNKSITSDFFKKHIVKFRNYEMFSLDEIPELNKTKLLTVNEKNDLIRQIPDDKFTEKEILKIIEYIKNGTMHSVVQFPNSTKKQPKVKLENVLLNERN